MQIQWSFLRPATRGRLAARRPRGILTIGLAALLVAAGCGPSGPKRIEVQGAVRFGGNPPPGDGTVYFAPVRPAEGFRARGGYGAFRKDDGHYVVGSVKRDDGLVPGTYRVTVECWERPPAGDGAPGKSYVPAGYVPPELSVPIDAAGPLTFDLDVPVSR